MTPSPGQTTPLEQQLEIGAQRAQRALQQAHCRDTRIELDTVVWRPMSALSTNDLGDDGELVAGAALRFGGEFSGSALFAMQPEAALELARARSEAVDPISSFVAFGERVATEALSAIAASLSARVDVGTASLAEDSVASILFGTHAPPDTAVVISRFHVSCSPSPDEALAAHLVLLVDPKTFEALLASAR